MPEEQALTLGARIRALREAKRITLRKFAAQVGVSPTYLSLIERGKLNSGSEDTLRKIAEALDQDVDEFAALAGKVSSDLEEIIREQPLEMAAFLRVAQDLTPDQIEKLTRQARTYRRQNQPKTNDE